VAAGVDPKLEIRKTGTRSTVTGVPCDELQIYQGGRRVADVCRASYADAGVSRESFPWSPSGAWRVCPCACALIAAMASKARPW
jgi:hypothetical protein